MHLPTSARQPNVNILLYTSLGLTLVYLCLLVRYVKEYKVMIHVIITQLGARSIAAEGYHSIFTLTLL